MRAYSVRDPRSRIRSRSGICVCMLFTPLSGERERLVGERCVFPRAVPASDSLQTCIHIPRTCLSHDTCPRVAQPELRARLGCAYMWKCGDCTHSARQTEEPSKRREERQRHQWCRCICQRREKRQRHQWCRCICQRHEKRQRHQWCRCIRQRHEKRQ